jgi:hypothetical protein
MIKGKSVVDRLVNVNVGKEASLAKSQSGVLY